MPPRKKQFSPLPKTSPNKNGENDLSFYDALRLVAEGKSVTKREWGNENIFLKLVNSTLCIHNADDIFHPLIVSDGDINGLDWVIVEHK